MRKVLFAKYNALRCPENQISTMIVEVDGERFVEKAPCTKEAVSHIQSFRESYEVLQKAHKCVHPAKPEYSGDVAVYEYIQGKTLEEELQEYFSDTDRLIEKTRYFLDEIYDYNEEYICDFKYTSDFSSIFGSDLGADFEGCKAVTAADIDLVFDNVIRKGDKWLLLDYEWVFTFPVPVMFLKYRTAAYFYDRHNLYFSKKHVREDYFELLGIKKAWTAVFDEMEKNFQKYVRGDYQYLKRYAKEIIPFRAYETYANELKARDDSIRFLNEVIASKEEYIESMEKLIRKYHDNPAYKVMNAVRNIFKKPHK